MTALITGSFAYDNILAFDGFFEESLIKEKLNDLSISFPILTSFTGSSDKETINVSPIPSNAWKRWL